MYLLIDIGNSTVVAAVATAACDIVASWRFDTIKSEDAQYYKQHLAAGLSATGISLETLTESIISSVVPEINESLASALEQLTGKTPSFFAVSDVEKHLAVDVDNKEQVGKDRLADALGAAAWYGCPAIVIDMGTATTVGVITEDRRFVGGMIIPGVKTSSKSLCDSASQLTEIETWEATDIVGRNTLECMQSGIILGNACMVDGIIDRITAQYGKEFNVVATGGMSAVIVPHCKHKIAIDKYLLFKGLFRAMVSEVADC